MTSLSGILLSSGIVFGFLLVLGVSHLLRVIPSWLRRRRLDAELRQLLERERDTHERE